MEHKQIIITQKIYYEISWFFVGFSGQDNSEPET